MKLDKTTKLELIDFVLKLDSDFDVEVFALSLLKKRVDQLPDSLKYDFPKKVFRTLNQHLQRDN